MSPLIIRPARRDDVSALMAVAADAGAGMTTVPQTEEAITARIEASIEAFAGTGMAAAKDIFFFVLDDGEGAIGMASIFPNLGEDRPFYSYRMSRLSAQAPEIGLTSNTDILSLVNDFHGYTEVGTLLIGQRARGRGAGRLLSLSRFLFMGAFRDRFSPRVMAEIRGWFNDDGSCPFWDHIAAKFFETSFEEADRLSAHDFRFISHLMPKFPIYVSLLPDEAKTAIGRAHPSSELAKALLESEGFEWTRCVDIFDGGPSLETRVDMLRTVRHSNTRSATLAESTDSIPSAEPFIVGTKGGAGAEFTVVVGHGHRAGNTVIVDPAAAERAGIGTGDSVIAAPLKG